MSNNDFGGNMRICISLFMVFLCSCSRFADEQIELSKDENMMVAPPCSCKVNAQNAALHDDLIYNI